jgi:hypothetical protein
MELMVLFREHHVKFRGIVGISTHIFCTYERLDLYEEEMYESLVWIGR